MNGTGFGGNTADGGNTSDNDSGYGGADGLGPGGVGMGADADAGIGGYGAANAGLDGPGSGDLGGFEANGYSPAGMGNAASAAAKAASAFGAPNTRTSVRAARANPQDRRDALSNANNEAIAGLDAQGLTAANLKARDIDGYAPSSAADRRGVTSRDMQSRDYSQAAKDAARDAYSNATPNGLLGSVAYGVNPALGLAANTTIDVNQAADYSNAYGMEKDTFGAIGNSLKGQAVSAVGGLLGGGVGGALGGAIAGTPGAMLGSIAGRSYGRDALGSAYGNSIGQPGQNNQAPSTTGAPSSQASIAGMPAQAPSAKVSTGYQSRFGTYDSHLSNFSSRALNAWA